MKVIGNLTESDIEKINEHVRKYGKGDMLKRMENNLLETCNYDEIIEYAIRVECADKKRCQDVIIESGRAKYILKFARFVEGADVKALQEAINKTKKKNYIFTFEMFVPGAERNLANFNCSVPMPEIKGHDEENSL